jgi:glycosyltransferase involved in cell wall biosynthesis
MKRDIVRLYPELAPKVHILPQPVPHWLASVDSSFCRRKRYSGLGLKLFYPAASYPHKNHSLLSNIAKPEGLLWPVNELVLTLDKDMNPAEHVPWVRCIGIISGDEMVKRYQSTDALLFLSKAESYGFPLVEAMYVGLPVVCPRLDYAIELCGQSAIYFDPDSIESLKSAIEELQLRLNRGWRPDWTEQLVKLPKSWDEVAERMINICFQEKNVLDENQNLSSLAVGSVRRSYSK